jgi:predicted dehydrogenase
VKNNSCYHVSRRSFLKGAAGLTVLTAAGSARSYAANDRVRIGIVGCGGMGSRHIEALCVNPRVELAAVCDVYIPRHQKARRTIEEMTGKRPSEYQDYRKFLEQDDIEAFWIASPDNWHPLLTIHGCQAGKDVYVEKPACPTVVEGRAMVTAARRHGRVVQLGTQQRSMPLFQQAIDIVHSGKLGQITAAGAWVDTNGWSVGEQPGPVPKGLDWDMWLGPAPWAPFSPQRFAGWMGWHDYARGGQLTNWGVHLMDIVHWGIKQDRPLSIQAIGGNHRQGAGSENFESIEAIFEYPGCNVKWTQRHSFKPGVIR